MTEALSLAAEAPEIAEVETADSRGRLKRVVTAASLTAVAGAASYLELTGKTGNWPKLADDVNSSLRHPDLGYLSDWAIRVLAYYKPRRPNFLGRLAAVAAIDIAVQTLEPTMLDSDHDPGEPFSRASQDETLKDFAFSIGGFGLFEAQNRRFGRKSKPAVEPAPTPE